MLEKILFNKTIETIFLGVTLSFITFVFFCLANVLAIMGGGELIHYILTNTLFTLPFVAMTIYVTYDHYKWSK